MQKMKKIVLDIQSGIHAHNMERMLMQKLDDYQVVISELPDSTAGCATDGGKGLFPVDVLRTNGHLQEYEANDSGMPHYFICG